MKERERERNATCNGRLSNVYTKVSRVCSFPFMVDIIV